MNFLNIFEDHVAGIFGATRAPFSFKKLAKQAARDMEDQTLVINGGNDLCTPYIAKYMYDRIPNAEWELFRTCRHMCFVEDNDRYVELMKEWLNKND